MKENKLYTDDFNPMKSDILLFWIVRLFRNHWLWMVLFYWIFALGGSILLAFLSKQAIAIPKNGQVELFEDYGNLINFGLVVPLGILLIRNVYQSITNAVYSLLENKVLVFGTQEEKQFFLKECERRINQPWAYYAATFLSIVLNIFIVLNLKNSWNSFGIGGIAAGWFRVVCIFNFAMTFFILFKSLQTVWMIRFIFSHPIQLQPLHQDKACGAGGLGKISGAINLFLALLLVYVSVLVLIDGISLKSPLFLGVLLVFFVLALFLFVGPLYFAHRKMKQQKEEILKNIHLQFQQQFENVFEKLAKQKPLNREEILQIESIEKIHQIAAKMPEWPVQIESITKLFAVGIGPILAALAKVLMKTKS